MRTRQNAIRSFVLDNLDAMGAPVERLLDRSGVRYDINSLEPKSTFGHNSAGWGLTHDDHQFIKSDGTSILRFLNPDTMKWQAQIAVVEAGKGIRWLNELEHINGEVYANIWQQDRIAIIQLNSGQVTGWIDLSQLRSRMVPPPRDIEGLGAYGQAMANGIAYDAAGGRLFVTGKNWPRLFEIRLRN
jgi:glutamine cyclotransferase